MKKIPTVFKRDPDNRKGVLEEWNEDCAWVRDGEGEATKKYDGTCILLEREGYGVRGWARREIKPGKTPPENYRPVSTDPLTGKTMGWEPVEQSSFYKPYLEALEDLEGFWAVMRMMVPIGTYELVGPKINGNPEKAESHRLVRHETASQIYEERPRTFESLRSLVRNLHALGVEGVVFRHPDGRMAKLKGRDFL